MKGIARSIHLFLACFFSLAAVFFFSFITNGLQGLKETAGSFAAGFAYAFFFALPPCFMLALLYEYLKSRYLVGWLKRKGKYFELMILILFCLIGGSICLLVESSRIKYEILFNMLAVIVWVTSYVLIRNFLFGKGRADDFD